MALGNDLLMGALLIGGGYIFIYHIMPGLQTGNFSGGFGGGGSFLPGVAATGQTRCWEIGDGTRACSCQGKQHFVMGKLRQCSDCTTYCATGVSPPAANIPAAAAPTATGHRCWVVNPSNGQKACACAGKSNFVMGVARTCSDCQTHCTTGSAPDLKRPTSSPTPPKQTNTGGGTWECKVTATGAVGKRWVCINRATRQSVIQSPAWSCAGKLATNFPVGYPCAVPR
jgi:hypothetical protein